MSFICPLRANIRILVAISAHNFRILATILDCDVIKFILSRAVLIKRFIGVENYIAFTKYGAYEHSWANSGTLSWILFVILQYDVIMTSYVKFDVIFEFPGIDFL